MRVKLFPGLEICDEFITSDVYCDTFVIYLCKDLPVQRFFSDFVLTNLVTNNVTPLDCGLASL